MRQSDPEHHASTETNDSGSEPSRQRGHPCRFPTRAETGPNGDEQESSVCRGYD
ncbi:hypothetical protein FHX42_002177 [Saccharopolyspora lacisalsi]|uniref:Uncharacterized protein n=1 Tax=Halosaccharopolyspora lacisalsi TaxID=1000566 RepID=A0A839DV88_9PSEU|nr:hypothetical protein [Halosaccharopolyspora lacisalsi]